MRWTAEWLAIDEQGARRIPAFEFLRGIDAAPRNRLLQILLAVRLSGGPHKWLDTESHDKMEGELDDLHEVRDRHGQTLYRLYVKWMKRTATVWVLDGRTKPNATKLPDAEYKKIRALADLVDACEAEAATADDFVQILLS